MSWRLAASWNRMLCLLLGIAAVPLATGKLYNDCSRRGLPDVVPVWSGTVETFFDDYRPLADIDTFLGQLAAAHPGLVTVQEIGKSWEGRALRVLEITSGGLPHTKPLIYLQGGMHAREWIATSAVLYLALRLLQDADAEAGNGPVTSMLQQFTFAILSPVNPDGYVYTWETNRFWRKTRSDRTQCAHDGAAGVDPNRNWGYTRGIVTKAHTMAGSEMTEDIVKPCIETYQGPTAFSEPETLAVANYLRALQNSSFIARSLDINSKLVPGPGYVAAFIDYHSYSMMLLPPWSFSAEWPAQSDGAYIKDLCKAMVASIKSSSGRFFRYGPELLPADPGTAPDWAYGDLGVRATMTMELEGSELGGSFCLPKEKIRSVGQEQFEALVALVAHLRNQGSEPSTEFGLFVGMPPPPPLPGTVRLWLQRNIPALHGWPEISVLVFGLVALATGVLSLFSLYRWRQLRSSASFSDNDDIE